MMDLQAAIALIRACEDLGINFIDSLDSWQKNEMHQVYYRF